MNFSKFPLLATIAMLGASLPAFADVEVADYLESFSASSFDLSSYEGWSRIVDGSPTYSVNTSGISGNALACTSYQTGKYDLLVTPQLKGDISFYFKRPYWNAMYKQSLQVYKCIKNDDGSFTRGDLIKDFADEIGSVTENAWMTEPLKLSLKEYTYLGFRMEYAVIDELSASYAMMPDKVALEFTDADITETANQAIYMDESNKVTLHPQIIFTNIGNVEYPAGETFTITPSFSGGADQAVTVTIPAIAVGGSYTYDTPFECVVPQPTGSDVFTKFRLNIKWGSTTKTSSYVEAYSYVAIPQIRHNNGIYTGAVIDYGTFQGNRSRDIELQNIGGAPLIVSSVTLPEGVEIAYANDRTLPVTLAASEKLSATITISGEHVGAVSGTVEFGFDNENVLMPSSSYTNKFNIKGKVVDANVYFVDFDDAKLPDGWFAPLGMDQLEFTATASSAIFKGYYLKLGGQVSATADNRRYLQTCKLKFNEGDKLAFSLARVTNAGELHVAISPDRLNWTNVADYSYTDLESTIGAFKEFTIDMPEGECYVRFFAGYFYLDNVYGGKQVECAYDIASTAVSSVGKNMVNYPLTVDYTFNNLGNTIADGSYKLTLQKTADGEATELESIGDIEAGSEFTVNVKYCPHETGEHVNQLVISTVGDDAQEIATANIDVNIAAESIDSENVIGEPTDNSSFVPFRPNIQYSGSEIVLPRATTVDGEEVLTALGSMVSNDIIELRYFYYNINSDKSYDLKVWLEDTDDAKVGSAFHGTDGMTLFYEGTYVLAKAGSGTDFQPIHIVGKEAFHHDPSKNLRIYVEAYAPSTAWIMMLRDTKNGIPGIYYTTSSKTVNTYSYMPALTIVTQGSPSELKGHALYFANNDDDERYVPLENATITAYNEENDVMYTTTSGEDGSYSLAIYQSDLDYEYSAQHSDVLDSFGKQIIVVLDSVDLTSDDNDFVFIATSGVKSIINDSLYDGVEQFYNLNGVRISRENLAPGMYIRRIGNTVQKVIVK